MLNGERSPPARESSEATSGGPKPAASMSSEPAATRPERLAAVVALADRRDPRAHVGLADRQVDEDEREAVARQAGLVLARATLTGTSATGSRSRPCRVDPGVRR